MSDNRFSVWRVRKTTAPDGWPSAGSEWTPYDILYGLAEDVFAPGSEFENEAGIYTVQKFDLKVSSQIYTVNGLQNGSGAYVVRQGKLRPVKRSECGYWRICWS